MADRNEVSTSSAEAGVGVGDASSRWREAFAWIGRELGGRIVSAERQARCRPAFCLEVERGAGRRLMRQQWLIDPVMRELRGVSMQSIRRR